MTNKRYSAPYKYGKRTFIYDRQDAIVMWVSKITKEEIEDNQRWMDKYNKPLWETIEDKWIVIDSVGLSREHWRNKHERECYLDQWNQEINEECEWLSKDFGKEIL